MGDIYNAVFGDAIDNAKSTMLRGLDLKISEGDYHSDTTMKYQGPDSVYSRNFEEYGKPGQRVDLSSSGLKNTNNRYGEHSIAL
jgi:hypothetical protein|tara:strand:- start:962 stop:1213 length:252 start_codon:yes stop_codon:yes gene_type:complete